MNQENIPQPEENPFANLGQPLPAPQSPEEESSLANLGDGAAELVTEGAMDVAFDFTAAGVEGAANVVGAVAEGGGEVLGALGEGCAGCASISAIFFVIVLAYGFVLALA